jgi:hypothetical protein
MVQSGVVVFFADICPVWARLCEVGSWPEAKTWISIEDKPKGKMAARKRSTPAVLSDRTIVILR